MALQMGFGLVQEQRLKMVMTPELRQAIQILQYSASELFDYVQQQVTENPVLELENEQAELEWDILEDLANWMRYLDQTPVYRSYYSSNDSTIEMPVAQSSDSLAYHLESQLCEFPLTKQEEKICKWIIHNIDERGYFDADPIQLCKRFLISEELFEKCLRVVQEMDPIGVGARSLSECLEIQLRRKPDPNEYAIQIARHHLEDVADGKWRKIAEALGISVKEVQWAVDEIKTCNPRPGSAYSDSSPRYVYPDVVVEKVDHEYVIIMDESSWPRLSIQPQFYKWLEQKELVGTEVEQHVKNWVQSALWLMKGIEQRRDTIYRVAEVIIQKQVDFLDHGIHYLKPLTLRQVAEELKLHESTISRATQHKYIQTPRGLFPFRYFFQSGLETVTGEELSQKTVKLKIKQLIEKENKQSPLSDQKITDYLKKEGIRISRRTVAKYREEMGIASSAARKRFL